MALQGVPVIRRRNNCNSPRGCADFEALKEKIVNAKEAIRWDVEVFPHELRA